MTLPRSSCDDHLAPLADFIDFGHLARYTMGEPALTEELLGTFCAQVADFTVLAAECRDDAKLRRAVHTLKGAARAIGAFPLAQRLAEAERALDEGRAPDMAALMAQVEAMRGACRRWRELVVA